MVYVKSVSVNVLNAIIAMNAKNVKRIQILLMGNAMNKIY